MPKERDYAAEYRRTGKLYHQNNKEQKLKDAREWKRRNREHLRQYEKDYYRTESGNLAIKARNSRRYKKCSMRKEDLRKLLKSSTICFYCQCKMDFNPKNCYDDNYATIEHLIPLSKDGTNEHENLVLACRKCNLSKGIKSLEEFQNEK